jgi:hypothetical protein
MTSAQFVQLTGAAGAAIGLANVHGPGPAVSVWAVAQPYVTHALTGALIGLASAVIVVLAWRPRHEPEAPRRQAIPERVRHEVWRRDRGSCVDCGSRGRLEYDHIIPVSRGGSNTPRNIELRCEPCNRRKGARV